MKRLIAIAPLIFILNISAAQVFNIDQSASKLSVKGTSTLHDWESIVEDYQGKTNLEEKSLTNTQLSAKVKSIKSGKSGMDKNTYVAMKEGEFSEILLKSNQLDMVGDKLTGQVELTIAGVTKVMKVELKINRNEKIRVYGEIPLKMTSFGIDPPVAVFGTIKTGDDVVIVVDFTLSK